MRKAILFFGTRFFRRGSRGGSRLSRIFVTERRALQRTALFYAYSDGRQLYVCPCMLMHCKFDKTCPSSSWTLNLYYFWSIGTMRKILVFHCLNVIIIWK